jgi:thiol-disulfide isomerase/thioredoxin
MMVAAACRAEPEPAPATAAPAEASPFADCAALTGSAAAGRAGSAADLPDLELPCFTGEQPVRLTGLRGPAVINLWASWCEPCREELPAMQRLADRTAGRLTVLTVDTGDRRDAAASFAAAKDVSLPTLYDRERKLASALGRITLPVTVFVDASGRTHVDPMPFDDARLAATVAERTGVTVAR